MALNYEKIVVTRNHIRTVEMERMNVKARRKTKTETPVKRVMSQEEKETHYRNRQLKKAEYIRDLVEINFMDMQATFVTLTFKEQSQTLEQCNRCLRNMLRSMKNKYQHLLYVAVVECGKNGEYHYHMILNTVYTSLLEQDVRGAWKWGMEIDVQVVESVGKVAGYMTKQFGDSTNPLYGKKRYLHSNDLQKPEILKSWEKDSELYQLVKEQIKSSKIEKEFILENEFAGQVRYVCYNKQDKLFYQPIMAVRKE